MRRALEHDRDLLGEEEPSNDLVLGAPALLGIFFALALICAVCFGFGYTSGHGLHLPARQVAATAPRTPAPGASPSDAISSESAAPAAAMMAAPENSTDTTKPSPGEEVAPAQPAAPAEAQAFPPRRSSAAEAPALSASQPVTSADPTAARRSAVVDTDAGAGVSRNLMVQIAAVTRAADAETLATALRHDGFASVVRTSTGDPFFHVQIGPFPTLAAAKAMRTRLADSGYNAFIKP